MDKIKELQKLGIKSGVTAVLDAIYGTSLHDLEDDVLDNCCKYPEMAVEIVRALITNTPGSLQRTFTSCAAGTPIENW